jgi:hypothetical protein
VVSQHFLADIGKGRVLARLGWAGDMSAREQVTADFTEGVGTRRGKGARPWEEARLGGWAGEVPPGAGEIRRCAEGRPKLTESAREFRKAFPCARSGEGHAGRYGGGSRSGAVV